MNKRSIGISILGYGLFFIYAMWFAATVSIILKNNSGDLIAEDYIYPVLICISLVAQLIGLTAVLGLKEWGRRLVIAMSVIIPLCLLPFAVKVAGGLLNSLIVIAIANVLVVLFFNHPEIKKQFHGRSPQFKKRILVVDDDKGLLRLLKTNLTAKGFHVLTAETGEQGLELAKNKKPDLILLDVILPKMKGRQVCASLKTNDGTKNIPVIFLTAKDSDDDIRAEREAGAIAHITKPVDSKNLLAEIYKILGV